MPGSSSPQSRDAQPRVDPRPPTDASGQATTTHAAPSVHDAVNAPAQPNAAWDTRPANVQIVARITAPLVTGPGVCPHPAMIYQEAPAQISPPPPGFTTVTGSNGTVFGPQVENVMSDSLYIGGRPSPDDVQQGGIGDCYFLSALMSISQRDPGKIKSIMVPDGQGGATVTLWRRTMSEPNWLKRAFGSKPKPQYSQTSIHVSEQLQYWLQTPLGAGQRVANGHGGFVPKGAQLRAAPNPRGSRWWGQINSSVLEVHRRDEYDTALWAPLLEKAFAAFAERHGQYGGSQGESPKAGSGYQAIDGGWSHQAMFMFYGAAADMQGSNEGGVQQQATQWAPGSQVLAQNPRVVDQLLLLQGRGDQPQQNEKHSPVLTATSMVGALIPRLQAAMSVAMRDGDYSQLPMPEQFNAMAVWNAILSYNATPAAPPQAKSTARAAIGTACARAVAVAGSAALLSPARSAPIKAMVELMLDLKNIGTDNSPGQRNIYGDHVYSVVAVNFASSNGQPVDLQTITRDQRPAYFPFVDTRVSSITLRNPHHANTPDATGSGWGPDGATQGVQSSGIFHMNLEQFFMNYTSVESGVFPKS